MSSGNSTPAIRVLGPADASLLERIAEDVFDDDIVPASLYEFLNDPRHHLAVAIEAGVVVGFVSSVHYVHPDKPEPELWINEVGVSPTMQGKGIGRALMEATLNHGRALGCKVAWVLTERDNAAAMALYASAGGNVPTDHVMIEFDL